MAYVLFDLGIILVKSHFQQKGGILPGREV
jgi:hypothetical protein